VYRAGATVSEEEGLGGEGQEVTGGQLPRPGLKGGRKQGALDWGTWGRALGHRQ